MGALASQYTKKLSYFLAVFARSMMDYDGSSCLDLALIHKICLGFAPCIVYSTFCVGGDILFSACLVIRVVLDTESF